MSRLARGLTMIAHRFLLTGSVLALAAVPLAAADLPRVYKVERQPLEAQVKRLVEALEFVGAPLPEADARTLKMWMGSHVEARAVGGIQEVLDKHCLAGVRISALNKIEVQAGPAKTQLAEQGWRVFLVKVANPQ